MYFLVFIFSFYNTNAQLHSSPSSIIDTVIFNKNTYRFCALKSNDAFACGVFKGYIDQKKEIGRVKENRRVGYSYVHHGFLQTGKKESHIGLKITPLRFKKDNVQIFEFKNRQRRKIPLIKLNIDFNNLYSRALLLTFREDSSRDEDWAMDARISNVLENDVGWNIQQTFFNIQVRPFRKNDKIPLIIELIHARKLRFSLQDFESFEIDEIYLFDAELKTYHQLLKGDVFIDLKKGRYSNRFFISFMQEKRKNLNLKYLKSTKSFDL
jgi:hypothetical protein